MAGMMPDCAPGFFSKPVPHREPLHPPTLLAIPQNTGKLQREVLVFRRNLLSCICMDNLIEISRESMLGLNILL